MSSGLISGFDGPAALVAAPSTPVSSSAPKGKRKKSPNQGTDDTGTRSSRRKRGKEVKVLSTSFTSWKNTPAP